MLNVPEEITQIKLIIQEDWDTSDAEHRNTMMSTASMDCQEMYNQGFDILNAAFSDGWLVGAVYEYIQDFYPKEHEAFNQLDSMERFLFISVIVNTLAGLDEQQDPVQQLLDQLGPDCRVVELDPDNPDKDIYEQLDEILPDDIIPDDPDDEEQDEPDDYTLN